MKNLFVEFIQLYQSFTTKLFMTEVTEYMHLIE